MGCSSCSKKIKTDKNLEGRMFQTINSQKPAIFNSWWGKILYFSLCLLLCLTPIINLICLFLFAKLIFTSSKTEVNENDIEIEEENGEID